MFPATHTHICPARQRAIHHRGRAEPAVQDFSTAHSRLQHCQTHVNQFIPSKWPCTAATMIICERLLSVRMLLELARGTREANKLRVYNLRCSNYRAKPPGMKSTRVRMRAQREREDEGDVTHSPPLAVCKFFEKKRNAAKLQIIHSFKYKRIYDILTDGFPLSP